MSLAEVLALGQLFARLGVAVAEAFAGAARGADLAPEIAAEIQACTEAIAVLPAIHAAQQAELREAVKGD